MPTFLKQSQSPVAAPRCSECLSETRFQMSVLVGLETKRQFDLFWCEACGENTWSRYPSDYDTWPADFVTPSKTEIAA
jgi:hypothetical protein